MDSEHHMMDGFKKVAFIEHKTYLKNLLQMIDTFQSGVVNKNAAQLCIECVTLCVMEMPVAMGKNISRIISRYSKMTQCISHSQAMLEFLSSKFGVLTVSYL